VDVTGKWARHWLILVMTRKADAPELDRGVCVDGIPSTRAKEPKEVVLSERHHTVPRGPIRYEGLGCLADRPRFTAFVSEPSEAKKPIRSDKRHLVKREVIDLLAEKPSFSNESFLFVKLQSN
jgi:hypothetical protein